MKLPNAENAIVDRLKIVNYLLDPEHVYGGAKARLLLSLGYSPENWQRLDADLHTLALDDVVGSEQTAWGMRYEIVGPLNTPSGRSVVVRSIWQIDIGTIAPRLITMYPE